MHRSRWIVLAGGLLSGLLLPATAVACLWDYDTIKMERSRFPDTLELITGKFLRHSPEFYEWRIQDRLQRLEAEPTNAALWDDLAVAYDKTGQHEKAIETALRLEEMQPGRYETAANLGTFYFHAGRIAEGNPYIDRALELNPNAHYGRERYQRSLAEYVLQQRAGDPEKLPLSDGAFDNTFAEFLRPQPYQALTPEENAAAIKGVLGMMRFANFESPILLEALGSLLTQGPSYERSGDAKLLAARAYLKASYEVPDGPVRTAYRKMAEEALVMQTPHVTQEQISLDEVEYDFQQELHDAEAWYDDLYAREVMWIREGLNPETEFDRLYAADPALPGMDVHDPMSFKEREELTIQIALIVAAVVFVMAVIGAIVLAILIIRSSLRRRETSDNPIPGAPGIQS